MTFFERVSNWNAARYEQVYDGDLLLNLLLEESDELVRASNSVDALDALCDIQFVANGGLWKLEATKEDLYLGLEQNAEMLDRMSECYCEEGVPLVLYLFTLAYSVRFVTNRDAKIMLLNRICMLCQELMFAMGLSKEGVNDALNIVCDSNDSKSIVKTDSSVKANIDKGPYFVAPEPKLKELLKAHGVSYDVH